MEANGAVMPIFEGWALVELMGHRQRIGYVREVEMFGGKLMRVDIPAGGGDITEFYGSSSIYSLRPCSEDVARDAAMRSGDPRPVRPVDYRLEHHQAPTSSAEDGSRWDDEGIGF